MLAGFVVLGVLVWWLRGALDPTSAPVPPPSQVAASDARVSPARAPARPLRAPVEAPPVLEMPEPPDLGGHDTVDPCTAGWEPVIPSGYDTTTIEGTTVAWSPGLPPTSWAYDVAFKATSVAYLIGGLLDEAAALTATSRRDRLTVIIYPSQAEFFARTRAPRWSSGLYDGGAVRLPVTPAAELGIAIPALRHEIMHAQLHTAVGCMPAWLNEGLAMYFDASPPLRDWLAMLRGSDSFDRTQLQGPTLVKLSAEAAQRAYAESLAMIIFAVEHGGEASLKTAVQTLRAALRESPRAGLELWDRLYPGASRSVVLDSLARKMFGMPVGRELDAILKGPLCCYGLRAVTELSCHPGSPPPEAPTRGSWLERSGPRRAYCQVAW